MRYIFTILIGLMLTFTSSIAQDTLGVNSKIYSIVTCPGEDTQTQMNISWAADTTLTESYVLYTTVKDKKWRKAKRAQTEQSICAVFDSIYSKTPSGENYYEDAIFLKCGAQLTDLTPKTEYMYKVISGPAENANPVPDRDFKETFESDIHHFKTSGDKKWSVAIIADFHSYTPLPKRVESAMGMMDKIHEYDPKMDWVLHLGDVCAWGGSYSFWKSLYSEHYFSDYMWAGVNGNHDNMTRKYLLTNEFFKNANFYPRNGYHGEEGVCYYFKYGNTLFVMLNNENMRSDEGLAAAQDWVRKVVLGNPAQFVVVCEHYQWFFGESGKSSQYARWSELFDSLGVDLALSGNNHVYVRTNALYQGKETDGATKGTVYVQAPSSDNERGVSCPDSLSHNKDIIKKRWTEGGQTVGAMHLSVDKKEMELILMDRNGNILDTVKVLAKR